MFLFLGPEHISGKETDVPERAKILPLRLHC